MKQKHLFVADPLKGMPVKLSTTVRLMYELQRRGHDVYICEQQHLGRLKDKSDMVFAKATKVEFGKSEYEQVISDVEFRSAPYFNAIHMRKDPPYDINYFTCTLMLEAASKHTKVYNSPAALREYNEKLAILDFPEFCQDALVAADPEVILKFAEDHAGGDAIIKPLMLFAGRDITRIDLNSGDLTRDQALELIHKGTNGATEQRIVQPFDKSVYQGEIRVCTLGGEIISWVLKKPAGDSFIANMASGAGLLPYQPTKEDINKISSVAKELKKKGVELIGIDYLGGYISEINITCPRIMTPPEEYDSCFSHVTDWFVTDSER